MRVIEATHALAAHFTIRQSSYCSVALEADGTPIALGGYSLADGRITVFIELTPQASEHPIAIVRAARAALTALAAKGLPIVAGMDCTVPGARRFLQFMGFAEVYPEVWQWQMT